MIELMAVIGVFPDNKFFVSDTASFKWREISRPTVGFRIKNLPYETEQELYKAIFDFTSSFPKKLFDDLEIFSELFTVYLLIIKNIRDNEVSYNVILDSDYFINYNYTDYLRSIIIRSNHNPSEILYINGEVDCASIEECKIVFGIDSDTKLINLGFEIFTKTIQRSLYDTDIKKISNMLKDNIERIYIFGHSLNLADYESLSYIFSSCEKAEEPEIIVYCYDKISRRNIIVNIRKILGDEKYSIYQRKNKLSFLDSKTAIATKKK